MYSYLIVYVLCVCIIISSFLILLTSNRIYSILYLIFIYMATSILFMYMGVVLLGIFYFLVYIGAVAVLFLFSVMILDLKVTLVEKDYTNFLHLFLLLFMFFIQLYCLVFENNLSIYSMNYEYYINMNDLLKIIGLYSFSMYSVILVFAGLILLVSMLGAIYLTNRQSGFFMRKQENPLFRNRHLHNISIY